MATISSNGTGGGNYTAGGSWSGGTIPDTADTALLKDGDVITYDRDDGAQAVAAINIEEGAKFIVGTNHTCITGAFAKADGGRDVNGVRWVQLNAGSTLSVATGTQWWQHIELYTSGTSLANMATFKAPSSTVVTIYSSYGEDDTNGRVRPPVDLEYCVCTFVNFRWNHNAKCENWWGRFYRCYLQNCKRNSGAELIDCVVSAPTSYVPHITGSSEAECGMGCFDRVGFGFTSLTEGPLAFAGSSALTVYNNGPGVYRNCYANAGYSNVSFTGWYGAASTLGWRGPDLLAMGGAFCVIHGNGSGEWGSDYRAEPDQNQWELEKVTDPYAGAAQGQVLRVGFVDSGITEWGARQALSFELPVEHGDGIAPTIKIYIPSGWTGLHADQIECLLDPSDEWGLRETQKPVVATTDQWQTITFTGGTVTRTSGDKGTIVLRIWLAPRYNAAKYLYFDDLAANVT